MRKMYLVPMFFLGSLFYGQVYTDTSEGIIIPRLAGNILKTAEANGIYSNAKNAILVYVTAPPDPDKLTGQVEGIDDKGFYYFDAASNRWIKIISTDNTITVLSQLLCSSSSNVGLLETARPASGVSVILPYSGGNGGAYSALSIPSTGVTNLTANLSPGNLSIGGGFLIFNIKGTPPTTGTATFNINLAGKTCSFSLPVQPRTRFDDIVNVSINGQIRQMMSRNLGANPILDPDLPTQAIMGDYYQWGRKDAVATSYTSAEAISGWNKEKAPDKAWNNGTETEPIKTENDPCPPGFRIPTRHEWVGFKASSTASQIGTWTTSSTDGANNFTAAMVFSNNGNTLTLPTTGYRFYNTGALTNRAYNGNYWSSTEYANSNAYNFSFSSTINPENNGNRANGVSVRCISE